MNTEATMQTEEEITLKPVAANSDLDFDLMPVKACLINDPDCESCQ
jgi:hypothetical protein